jgi:tetratricopeptide (TPR) repeat protein
MPKPKLPEVPEAFSLFGVPLNEQPPGPEIVEKQRALYEEALRNWERMPEDADSIIWLGRRTAYLGRIREAAAIFSLGVETHPDDPWMKRHRGTDS